MIRARRLHVGVQGKKKRGGEGEEGKKSHIRGERFRASGKGLFVENLREEKKEERGKGREIVSRKSSLRSRTLEATIGELPGKEKEGRGGILVVRGVRS